MTEYWVSQGNKWCDFCKIYISNNPLSIRTHELGQRHKDNVAKKLATMRKESAAKEKEQKEAARALKEIEAKAKRSYQKDLASFEKVDASRREPNKKNADEGQCSSATINARPYQPFWNFLLDHSLASLLPREASPYTVDIF